MSNTKEISVHEYLQYAFILKKSQNFEQQTLLLSELVSLLEKLDSYSKIECYDLIIKISDIFGFNELSIDWHCKKIDFLKNSLSDELLFFQEVNSLLTKSLEKGFYYTQLFKLFLSESQKFRVLYDELCEKIFIHNLKNWDELCSFFKRNSYEKNKLYPVIFVPIKRYCLTESSVYHEIKTTHKDVIYFASCFNGKKLKRKTVVFDKTIPCYVAEVQNAKLLASSGVILSNSSTKALSNIFFDFDLKRITLDTPLRRYVKAYSFNHQALICEKETYLTYSEIEGIYIGGVYAANFYHWIIEHLPSFYLINQYKEYERLPVLVEENTIKHPNMLEALKRCCGNRQIISLKEGASYSFKKIVLPSKLAHITPSVKDDLRFDDTVIKHQAITYLRDIFFKPNNQVHRCIFLARKMSAVKRISNQEEIIDIFKQYNFEIIYPEELSLDESIELFSQVKIVAGATGAAMTNIIFAPKNTKIIVLLNETAAKNTIFSNIAGIIGQEMLYILGKDNKDTNLSYHNSFYINPSDIDNCLKKLCK